MPRTSALTRSPISGSMRCWRVFVEPSRARLLLGEGAARYAQRRSAHEKPPLLMRQIVLDTETTGLEPAAGHRVIEIGCVELVNRRPTQNRFHRYINPEREVDRGALEVHGIENEFLATQPKFAEVAAEFVEFVNGAEL